jgi:RNA polymerase sigma factor (sigma-70 family)
MPVDCSPERLQRALDALRSSRAFGDGAGSLYQCYYRRILGFFLRKLQGSPESEDLTQNVFLNVFSRGPKCPADLPGFEAYLGTAARNAYIDAVRRQPELRSLEDDPALAEERLSAPPSQEEEAILQERARKLQAALDQLSPGQRVCLLLRSQGRSLREIAGLRGCAEDTVKALLHQGRTRLRRLLKGDFADFDLREEGSPNERG